MRTLCRAAFPEREEHSEALGAVHLLQHGAWAFKADTITGGRTDLVLGGAPNETEVLRSGASLVLTEWKMVREVDAPRQLEGQTLLHDGDEEGWRVWLQAVGWRVARTKSVIYPDYNLVLEAAANGLGFAMGRGPLVAHLVDSGRLLAAHARTARSPRQYYLITSGAPQRPEVKAFTDWLRAHCRRAALQRPGSRRKTR